MSQSRVLWHQISARRTMRRCSTSRRYLSMLRIAGAVHQTHVRHRISGHLSYFRFLGDLDDGQMVWVDVNGTTRAVDFSLADSTDTQAQDAELPFLCTNSAPHTSKVDTDFSKSPKTNVISNGTIFTGYAELVAFCPSRPHFVAQAPVII